MSGMHSLYNQHNVCKHVDGEVLNSKSLTAAGNLMISSQTESGGQTFVWSLIEFEFLNPFTQSTKNK